MSRATLFFDLDGTLIDSQIGITRCITHAFERMQHPAPPVEALRGWIGPSLRTSFGPLFNDAAKVEQAVAYYCERFETEGWQEHAVFDDIEQVVRALQARGHEHHGLGLGEVVLADRGGAGERARGVLVHRLQQVETVVVADVVVEPGREALDADRRAAVAHGFQQGFKQRQRHATRSRGAYAGGFASRQHVDIDAQVDGVAAGDKGRQFRAKCRQAAFPDLAILTHQYVQLGGALKQGAGIAGAADAQAGIGEGPAAGGALLGREIDRDKYRCR